MCNCECHKGVSVSAGNAPIGYSGFPFNFTAAEANKSITYSFDNSLTAATPSVAYITIPCHKCDCK